MTSASIVCGLFAISSQDTIRNPPSESKQMKKATFIGIMTTTFFYMSVAVAGYAAFGDSAPGNLLTGFTTPFWLVDFANTCIVIHLIGAYQVPYSTQCFLNLYTYTGFDKNLNRIGRCYLIRRILEPLHYL